MFVAEILLLRGCAIKDWSESLTRQLAGNTQNKTS